MILDPYTIESTETAYKPMRGDASILFRSRLEARWAYAFDALHLTWEYEPAQFHLPDGAVYTPDFYVEGVGYIEIKPGLSHLMRVEGKLRRFAWYAADVVPQDKIATLYSIDTAAPALMNGYRGSVIHWIDGGIRVLRKEEARTLLCAPDSEDFRKDHPDVFADHVDRVLAHAGEVRISDAVLANAAVGYVRETMEEPQRLAYREP